MNNNSPIQDYVHPEDQTQPTFEITWMLLKKKKKKRRIMFRLSIILGACNLWEDTMGALMTGSMGIL